MGSNLRDFGLGKAFLNVKPKAQMTKEKIHKLDFIRFKNFCASKDTIKKVKRQHTEWVTIFANH